MRFTRPLSRHRHAAVITSTHSYVHGGRNRGGVAAKVEDILHRPCVLDPTIMALRGAYSVLAHLLPPLATRLLGLLTMQ